MHCTTQLEVRVQRVFGQWLQLMHCTYLLSHIQVFLYSKSRDLEVNLESSIALIEESIEFRLKLKLEYFWKFIN